MSDTDESALYRVGITNSDKIELTVGYPSSISLTMCTVGTKNLIALLQAAVNTLETHNEA